MMVKKILMDCSYDLEAVERFLEKAAADGLMFVKKDGMIYYFEKCEPRSLKFSLDVFEKASVFDTRPEPMTEEYIEYCKESGWIHCGTYGKIQVFYSENLNAVPIRTDEERLKSIHKNVLVSEGISWLLYTFFFVMFSVINPFSWGLARALIEEIHFLIIGWAYLVFGVGDFTRYLIFYVKNKNNIKNGRRLFFYSVRSLKLHHLFRTVTFATAMIVLLCGVTAKDPMIALYIIGLLLVIMLVVLIMRKISGKREKASRVDNITSSVALIVILCAVMFYVPVIFILGGSFLDPNVEKVSYYDNDDKVVATLHKEKIPFGYEKIGIELDDKKYISTERDETSSVFGLMDSWDETVYDKDMKELFYIRVDVLKTKYPEIIDSHMDKIVYDYYKNVTQDKSEVWEAKEVYYYKSDWDEWIVKYDDIVVEVTVDNINLTEDMIKNISDLLTEKYN